MSTDTRLLVSVMVLMFLPAGCDDPSGPVVPEDYFPMELGDWWEYDFSATRIYPDTLLWEVGTDNYSVTDVIGDTCLVVRTSSRWYSHGEALVDTLFLVDSLRYVLSQDSVMLVYSGASSAVKILDLPLELGKTWDVYTVTGIDEDVSTPAGMMEECAVVESYSSEYGYSLEEWYRPEVGAVMRYSPDFHIVEGYVYELLAIIQGSSRL